MQSVCTLRFFLPNFIEIYIFELLIVFSFSHATLVIVTSGIHGALGRRAVLHAAVLLEQGPAVAWDQRNPICVKVHLQKKRRAMKVSNLR